MRLSVVVPVLNEKAILPDCFRRLDELRRAHPQEWEIVVSDAGSRDGSLELARAWAERSGATLVAEPIASPSVGKTVAAGIARARGELLVILPCDTAISPDGFAELWREAVDGEARCGGFAKRYLPATALLRFYAGLQNAIRFRLLRHLVWTNGIFFRGELLQRIRLPTDGFLEDVILSDALRGEPGWKALRSPVEVSARRYYPDRVVERIFVNLAIMALYRMKLAGPARLRRIYLALK